MAQLGLKGCLAMGRGWGSGTSTANSCIMNWGYIFYLAKIFCQKKKYNLQEGDPLDKIEDRDKAQGLGQQGGEVGVQYQQQR